jgi:hypothetical protein
MPNPSISLAQRALLPIALVQLAVPVLPQLGVGAEIGDSPQEVMLRAPETPPGPFFAIWGVIFLAYLGTAIWAQRSSEYVVRSVTPPLALAGLASITWMLMRQARLSDFAVHGVLLALFVAAYIAAERFDRTRGMGGSPGRWVMDVTTGLLAGWMTLAVSLSTTNLVRTTLGLGNTDAEWWMLGLALLIALGAALFAFARVTASPYFVIALAWGLAGVVLNLWVNVQLHVPALLAGFLTVGLLYRRSRYGASGARSRRLT